MHDQPLMCRTQKVERFLFDCVKEADYLVLSFRLEQASNKPPKDVVMCGIFISSKKLGGAGRRICVVIFWRLKDMFQWLAILPLSCEIPRREVFLKGQMDKMIVSVLGIGCCV